MKTLRTNAVKRRSLLAATAIIALSLTVCKNGTTPTPPTPTTPTPVAADYVIGNLTQTVGSVTAVTITPKAGKSSGAVTIYYAGTGTTTYPKSTDVPSASGTYAVTFDVAAATGWNAATALIAGTLTIYAPGTPIPGTPTPVAADYNIGNLTQTVGSVTAVSVTAKSGKSTGTVTIYYAGTGGTTYSKSSTVPSAVGTYAVTFDVAAVTGWNAATDLIAGTLTIKWPLFEMVHVPGGGFQMGKELGPYGEGDETPVHMVTLTGFYMSKYEVTQAQYQAVMGSNPSRFNSDPASGEIQGNRPVENVNWYDAIVFCNRLSMAEDLNPAYSISGSTNPSDWGAVPDEYNSTWDSVEIVAGSNGYRLPTDAQWEYAAKGGNSSNYTYSGSNWLADVAWYEVNSGNKTHEVGKKTPNRLGIYDMSGNVWEWCWDWWEEYSSGAQTDPQGAASGPNRVARGGSWNFSASSARSVARYYSDRSSRSSYHGFRLVHP